MENNSIASSSRTACTTDRKFIERNRRHQMKALYSALFSIVPHQSSREADISLPDQLDAATNYIKKLQINVEKLRDKKDMLLGIESMNNKGMVVGFKSPQIEIQQMGGSCLEVVLMTGLDCQFSFNDTIRVLHEEGADIVNATYTLVGDTVFHTIHCQVVESADNGAARISERLNKFLYDSSA